MESLFYFLTSFALLFELAKLNDTKGWMDFVATKYEKGTKEHQAQSTAGVLMLVYFIWSFIGLLTSQWLLFVLIMVLSVIGSLFKNITWRRIDGILTIILLLAIVLNKYHFGYQF